MIVRYVIAWLPMVVIGIINGVIREQWYGNYLSELRAHQVSTVTGAVLFGQSVASGGLSRVCSLFQLDLSGWL